MAGGLRSDIRYYRIILVVFVLAAVALVVGVAQQLAGVAVGPTVVGAAEAGGGAAALGKDGGVVAAHLQGRWPGRRAVWMAVGAWWRAVQCSVAG